MKKLIIGLLVVGLLLVGCSPVYSPPENTPPANGETTILPGEPPLDRTWISPGKVQVGNFHPGARAEWNLLVHNGKNTTASFLVTYRYPNYVEEGYNFPTAEVQDWVIIADPTPVLAPKETRAISIVLEMPEDATAPGKLWEFWISVKDTTQTGMVVTELCSRWCVSQRN